MASLNADDIVTATSALTQENYELRRRLELAKRMETDYLDEIEQLKIALQEATSVQPKDVCTDPNDSLLVQLEDRAQTAEGKVLQLQMELCSSQKKLVEMEDKLATVEFRLGTRDAEVSSHKLEYDRAHCTALSEEVSHLKEELTHIQAQHQLVVGRLERQLVEMEEDRSALQRDLSDMERQLKETRIELADTRAQLEAMEMQANCPSKSRGNSAFNEVEDRRIRAERIVLQQRQMIDELRLEAKKAQAEAKRKLLTEVQKLETRYRERDTKFTDNLVTERERLQAENRALTLQLQQLEELQLDNERRAVKTSKAFDFEGNTQESLIKTLEQRISVLKHRLADKTNHVDGLRDQVMKANLLIRQMQTELWLQTDLTSRLSEQLDSCQRQLKAATETSEPMKPVLTSNEQIKPLRENSVMDSTKSKLYNIPPTADKPNQEAHMGSENKAPSSDFLSNVAPAAITNRPESSNNFASLSASERFQPNSSELPPECKTS